jgi:hypothetical protein
MREEGHPHLGGRDEALKINKDKIGRLYKDFSNAEVYAHYQRCKSAILRLSEPRRELVRFLKRVCIDGSIEGKESGRGKA